MPLCGTSGAVPRSTGAVPRSHDGHAHPAGRIVIDTYYPQRDGTIAVLDSEQTTVSELPQADLPNSQVVKAFNHIRSGDLA